MDRIESILTENIQDGRIGNHEDLDYALWKLSRTLSANEIQQTLANIEAMDLPDQVKQSICVPFLHTWAKQDGEMAMEYALKTNLPTGPYVITPWIMNDFSAADRWLKNHRDTLHPSLATYFEADLITSLAAINFDQALDRVSEKSQEPQADLYYSVIVEAFIHDQEKLQSLSKKSLTFENQQTAYLIATSIVDRLGWNDIERAAQFATTWEGKKKADIIQNVANSWSHKEPAKGVPWALKHLDDSAQGRRSLALYYKRWSDKNQKEASEWLSTLPAEKQRIMLPNPSKN